LTPLLIGLLAGCGLLDGGAITQTCEDLPQGCDGTTDGGGDTAAPIDIAVDTLDPVYGLLAGGDSVLITGGPFAADALVTFGGQPAELRTWKTDELRVMTPASSTSGWTEVAVSTSAGSGANSKAYRYFRDGTGQVGMVGLIERSHPLGALASTGDAGLGTVAFIAPKAGTSWWLTQAPDWDTCRSSYVPSLGWEYWDPGTTVLELEGRDGDHLPMAWDSVEQAYNGIDGTGTLPVDRIVPGEIYDIFDFGGTELPTFSAAAVTEIPAGLTVTQPELNSTTLRLGATDLSFAWDTTNTADGIYLTLTLANATSGDQIEKVTCLAVDDGAFTVPSDVFTQWSSGLTLYMKIGRGLESSATLPLNNADIGVVGAYALLGAASTY